MRSGNVHVRANESIGLPRRTGAQQLFTETELEKKGTERERERGAFPAPRIIGQDRSCRQSTFDRELGRPCSHG